MGAVRLNIGRRWETIAGSPKIGFKMWRSPFFVKLEMGVGHDRECS